MDDEDTETGPPPFRVDDTDADGDPTPSDHFVITIRKPVLRVETQGWPPAPRTPAVVERPGSDS